MDFRPLDPASLSWPRRALLPLAPAAARLLRWLWNRSGPARSTWFDSRRWRAVWNVNRWLAAVPRQQSSSLLVRFAPRLCMELDLSRLTDVLAYCYGPGEIEVGYIARRLCPPDAVIADLGGNIGTTTLAFAAVATAGEVHSFEPSPAMLACLRRNIALSGADRVKIHAYGLADQPTRQLLTVAIAGNPGSAYLVAAGENAAADSTEVEVRRLDDVFPAGSRLDFVKLDIEGHELRALRGAAALLQQQRPVVVCEINETALRRAGTSGREVCDWLAVRGYRLYYLVNGRFCDYDAAAMAGRKLHNVVAVHPESPAAGRLS